MPRKVQVDCQGRILKASSGRLSIYSVLGTLAAGLLSTSAAVAQPPPLPPLPPPPAPAQNPVSEAKRVLGKVLFWDEQVSSDNTVACGTCHLPGRQGTDPRIGRNPGLDQTFNTADDVLGSPGVVAMDSAEEPIEDPIFGFDPQVTRRAAPTNIMAAYSNIAQFWDGRRSGTFVNPETGATTITAGAALENQALEPILSDVEMGHSGRNWGDVRTKLQTAAPLALASNLPADLAAAVSGVGYPQLFAAAFGTADITAERIAFAIATYERTLVPNQSPWDRFNAGDLNAMTAGQRAGLNTFVAPGSRCNICHAGNQFTNHVFRNIGLRPLQEDQGRFEVTGALPDRGRFKTPTLRNVGLKNRFMHTGRLSSLEQVIDFYRQVNGQVAFPQNRDPLVIGINIPPQQVANLVDFLRNGLTDPRVASEQFPFDRPKLRSELLDGDVNCDGAITVSDISPFVLILTDIAAYAEQFPTCNASAADMNLDGTVTVGDIGSFVNLLTGT